MSIAEIGSGILKTHVTWEDVENTLLEATGDVCKFGENKEIVDIGEGNGLLSKIALVTADWQEPKPALPDKFVVKILSLLPQVELEPSVVERRALHDWFKEGHNREVLTYQVLWRYKTGSLPLPKIYASKMFTEENQSKGFIIMEYIENGFVKPAVEDVELEDVNKALTAVAELVRITSQLTEDQRMIYSPDLFRGAVSFYTPEMVCSQMNDIEAFLGVEEKELVAQLAQEARFFLCGGEMLKLERVHEALGMEPVLSHGDLWSPNLLWRKDGGNLSLAAIIDYQIANMGTSATDLVTVVCSTLSCKVRRENYHNIIEMFYNQINSQKHSPAFTLMQLEMACERMFPFCAYNAMSSMVAVIPNSDLCKFQTSRLQCQAKCKGLIEDIIEASKRLREITALEG